MKRRSTRAIPTEQKPIDLKVAKAIKQFSDSRRNMVRGTISATARGSLSSAKIDILRSNIIETDMVAAAAVLEAPGGLRKRKVAGFTDGDLPLVHSASPKSAQLEAAYACGFLNAWRSDTETAIETIRILAEIAFFPEVDALTALLATAKSWGSSTYLSRKIAYAKEFFDLTLECEKIISEIDVVLEHKKFPNLQFYALENIKSAISLFTVARRHTNIMQKVAKNNFRAAISLNTIVATPVNEEDCAGFLLRSVESSLIDTVAAIWIIFNLRDRFPDVFRAIKRHLDSQLIEKMEYAISSVSGKAAPALVDQETAFDADASHTAYRSESNSFFLYRRCAAFLEFSSLCSFRNDIDQVIGYRLMAPLMPEVAMWPAANFDDKDILKKPNGPFDISLHNSTDPSIDTFYRTYLFLRFIQDAQNVSSLNSSDIEYIFDNTVGLESLFLEKELRTLHYNAADEAKALISVLAMALYRAKSSDPDVDFDFRSRLETYIHDNFSGNITEFIDYIAPRCPEIANYIVTSLDEATLQKMYTIISSLEQAEAARRDILTTVGIHLNKIEYIVEAEAIETRAKVAKLKDYFDTSRMFVDSIAMKKWLSSNPSVYTQQFKENLPKLAARFAATKSILNSKGEEARLDIFSITTTDEYLVAEMAREAFREFCISNEFGIESYLGRRIRHNTLRGFMTKSTDAVLKRQENQPIIVGTPFGRAIAAWESQYNIYIERMRKEFLQFKSDSKPNALFNSAIDPVDPFTKRNIQQLVQTLNSSSLEMLDELIVSFCWRQVAPQLDAASRQIRVSMAQEVTQSLDQSLNWFDGPEERKIKSALNEEISSVFAQVASWFQVPQTGFVPASIGEICNIIDMDNGRPASTTTVSGDLLSTRYYGISVHRLYDCLAALLQNAFKHGRSGSEVLVQVKPKPLDGANLHILEISVRSKLSNNYAECISRVESAVSSSDTGKEMVTEGYSGIKKVKFITRLNEGNSTVNFHVEEEDIILSFVLRAEVADEESEIEDSSS